MISKNSNNCIIVSGTGYKYLGNGKAGNIYLDKNCRPNIGSTIALSLAEEGYEVLMLSRTSSKLKVIQRSILEVHPQALVSYMGIDLLNPAQVATIGDFLPEQKTIHLVHSMGLSAGAYQLPDDNPYLPIEATPPDLPTMEFESVVKSLLILVKVLLPLFEQQPDTRLIAVSSMSGIRSFPWGFSHTSAKAGLHHAIRSLALELGKKNIFVSEVNPGIVNTGLYDPPAVRKAVVEVAKAFGYHFQLDDFPQMDPIEVARAVLLCLSSEAHVLQVNLVAKGQYPNLGS